MAEHYTADQVDKLLAKTKLEVEEYIDNVIQMKKIGGEDPTVTPELWLKETTVENENNN